MLMVRFSRHHFCAHWFAAGEEWSSVSDKSLNRGGVHSCRESIFFLYGRVLQLQFKSHDIDHNVRMGLRN